jgi:hypothetical protein
MLAHRSPSPGLAGGRGRGIRAFSRFPGNSFVDSPGHPAVIPLHNRLCPYAKRGNVMRTAPRTTSLAWGA